MKLEELKFISDKKRKVIPKRYEGDIRRFKEWCYERGVTSGTDSMLDYLCESLNEQEVKKNTWERRLSAIRKYLAVSYGVDFKHNEKVKEDISDMRAVFGEPGREHQNETVTPSRVDLNDLLLRIEELDVRRKALVLVNLITASKPSEMVQIKVKDFNFDQREVVVRMRGRRVTKLLSLKVTRALRKYFRKYGLKADDYLVGRVYKNGRYKSVEISTDGYRKIINECLGFPPTVLKVTQISEMHERGADLLIIAKQSGHKDLTSLIKHNIQISKAEVEKYL